MKSAKYRFTAYIFISEVKNDMVVVSGVANKTTFKESYVEYGRIEIDKLEDKHFECQIVIEFGLCPMHF